MVMIINFKFANNEYFSTFRIHGDGDKEMRMHWHDTTAAIRIHKREWTWCSIYYITNY